MIRNILPLYTEVPHEPQMPSGVATAINSIVVSRIYSYSFMGAKIINIQTNTRAAIIFTHTRTRAHTNARTHAHTNMHARAKRMYARTHTHK
jgi:hypothetical protein